MTRVFIEEYDGWPGKNVDYYAAYDDGTTQIYSCSKLEWEAMELKKELMSILTLWNPEKGEKLLKQFEEKSKEIARENEWINNLGEEI